MIDGKIIGRYEDERNRERCSFCVPTHMALEAPGSFPTRAAQVCRELSGRPVLFGDPLQGGRPVRVGD